MQWGSRGSFGRTGTGASGQGSRRTSQGPDTAGYLVDYLLDLIQSGECKKANDLADAVNTGAALED
ncbi:hypothetical protein ACFLU6_04140 [Acidobacteriota bacterium]